ncbi:MAG: hypothetical protein O7G85_10520 [Planctomycetota bacterium]|nr:hypothetical protein [Planctomycetota bacterium]
MKLKDAVFIGMMAVLSLSLMQSDSGRVRADDFGQSKTETIVQTSESEIAGLLAMAQSASNLSRLSQSPSSHAPLRHAGQTKRLSEVAPQSDASTQFIDECMLVAEQINPEWAARMRSACEKTPEDFERFVRRSGRRLVALVELRRRDPQLYQIKIDELRIEAQLNGLVHKLHHLHTEGQFDSPEAGELKEELYTQVLQQVAFSLKARGDYIVRLKNHVQALEDQISEDAFLFLRTADERYKTLIDMD